MIQNQSSPRFYSLLSLGAAVFTTALKAGAYVLTGSVGLLSDAADSTVDIVAALVGFWALSLAVKPSDDEYPFGYFKAEYFSSGVEGALVLVAAGGILFSAVERLLNPQPLEQLGLGLALSIVAMGIKAGTAALLLQAGKRLRSMVLRANGANLLADVWTSIGVLLSLLLVTLTGWQILDPLIAIGVGLNVLWTGIQLLQETAAGLLDKSIPSSDRTTIEAVLAKYHGHADPPVQFHAVRTRRAGSRCFVTFHVLVPGAWTVQQGHDLCESIELAIAQVLPGAYAVSHLEPLEDPASWHDQDWDRTSRREAPPEDSTERTE